MAKDKVMFSTFNDCNTRQIIIGDDRSLSIVGFGKIPVNNVHFHDVLHVSSISSNFILVYHITHSSEDKIIVTSPSCN